jgi:hypothetical protein
MMDVGNISGRENTMDIVVIMKSQPQLLHIVSTLSSPRGLPGLLNGG